VQIKRPDPHPPEHEQPDPNALPLSQADREAQADGQLVSEVATCPFCKQPEFGITYVPLPFRRGLTYNTGPSPYQMKSAVSSQTSVSSSGMSGSGRRRGTSISATAPEVVTTDKIRPDWASKLATARAHAARRSAAATALHTAAYLMNGQDGRQFGPFSRRGMLRRPTLEGDAGVHSAHMSAFAMLAERHAQRQQEMDTGLGFQQNPFLPPPRASSSRRSRMDDLEDMMMMEAIRLSLAAEEERRKKEEKEAKKEAKKKGKEAKKAEKAAKKSGLYITNSNVSNEESVESTAMDRTESVASSIASEDGATFVGKGKAVDRIATPPIFIGPGASSQTMPMVSTHLPGISFSGTSQESLPSPLPSLGLDPVRRSHLRQMSNASSSTSSFAEPGSSHGFPGSNTPPGGGAGIEPMFNFRSLAAMIGDEEKTNGSSHIEDAGGSIRAGFIEELEDSPEPAQEPGLSGGKGKTLHERNGTIGGKAEAQALSGGSS
jgi:hypothetical protein